VVNAGASSLVLRLLWVVDGEPGSLGLDLG